LQEQEYPVHSPEEKRMTRDESDPSKEASSSAPTADNLRESNLKVYDRILATVSVIGLIIGGVWGLYSHFQQKAAEALQRDQEIELRKHELDLLIFQEKKEAYLALCDAACEVVACQDRAEVAERSRAFRKLFYGRAHIIADPDPEVSDKKIEFNNKLTSYLTGEDKGSTKAPFLYFGSAALNLTKVCRKHIDPRQLSSLDKPGIDSPSGETKAKGPAGE
jgi:hypothetical protein